MGRDLEKILAQLGYELQNEADINEEELSRDELRQVAGGIFFEDVIDMKELCLSLMELFQADADYCY